MNNMLSYKGYFGTVEFSDTDNTLFGKVIGINSLISFECDSVKVLKADFEGAVDDYLKMCMEKNIAPEKPYKGNFNVRIMPELHKNLDILSRSLGQSLNATVEDAIKKYVENPR
jgi:predicted HicB family RNase H-like nuclease